MKQAQHQLRKNVPKQDTMIVKVATTLSVLTGAFVVAFFLVSYFSDDQDKSTAGPTSQPVDVRVEQQRLRIPANMLRLTEHQAGGAFAQVELAIHWPSLEGYTSERDAEFNNVSTTSPIILISLAPTQNELDSTGRLATIYLSAFTDEKIEAPKGLVARRLDPNAGYVNEVIYFEAGSTVPFTAICSSHDEETMPADCLRQINLSGGLTLSYRFRRHHLAAWKELETSIYALAASFLSAS